MSILVTGANGFFGKYLQKAFRQQSVETLGLGSCDININLASAIPRLITSYDMVVHAAGKAHLVPRNKYEEDTFYQVNVTGTRNLLTALEEAGRLPGSFVFISTVAVYGLDEGKSISEESPLFGNTPYALSKIQAEQMLRDWGSTNKVSILILRLPLLVGQNPPGNLGQMIRAIKQGYYFRIGTGSARRSMVLAEDVAEFIASSIGKSGTYNLTDGYHPTYQQLEETIATQSGKRIKTIPAYIANAAARVGDYLPGFPINTTKLQKLTSSLTFSDEKARREVGWKPKPVLANLANRF